MGHERFDRSMGGLPCNERRAERKTDHPARPGDLLDQIVAEISAMVAYASTVGVACDDRAFGDRYDIADSFIIEVRHVNEDLQLFHPFDDLMTEGLQSSPSVVGKAELILPIPPDRHQAHSPRMKNFQSSKIAFKDSPLLDAQNGVAPFGVFRCGNMGDRFTVLMHQVKKASVQLIDGVPPLWSLLSVDEEGEAARYPSFYRFHLLQIDMTGIRSKITARISIGKGIHRVDMQVDNRSVHRNAPK